uniref:Uncharacterized protein n=1 Tax=Arundo donax TaxID=35708 RepID=A0A0A8ZRD1_ARUDO
MRPPRRGSATAARCGTARRATGWRSRPCT